MVTIEVLLCIKILERVLLWLFLPYLMFFIIDNQRGILSYQIRQLPCRARGARAHNLFCTYRSACAVLYMETIFFFPLIDRLVCKIQNNQTLDALIKYVA